MTMYAIHLTETEALGFKHVSILLTEAEQAFRAASPESGDDVEAARYHFEAMLFAAAMRFRDLVDRIEEEQCIKSPSP